MINQKYSVLAKYAKDLASKSAALPGNEILNMDSWSGTAADFLSPHAIGGRRAGRAQAMGDAAEEKVPFNVRHPMLGNAGATLTGMTAGGVAGAGLGAGINAMIDPESAPAFGGVIGGLTGAGLGGLAGHIIAAAMRRSDMRYLQERYDKKRIEGKLVDKVPEFSSAGTLLAPYRGPHRSGQIKGYDAINSDKAVRTTGLAATSDALRHTPYVSDPATLILGSGENFMAANDAKLRKREFENKKKDSDSESKDKSEKKEDGKKEASFSKALDLLLLDLRR